MQNIDLSLAGGIAYGAAEKAAKEAAAAQSNADLSLLAWFDKAKNMGAPQEACSLESWKCVRDYAEHHRADLRVSVNDDEYEFYFFRVSVDAEELDREEVETVHTGIARDQFDNVQGG